MTRSLPLSSCALVFLAGVFNPLSGADVAVSVPEHFLDPAGHEPDSAPLRPGLPRRADLPPQSSGAALVPDLHWAALAGDVSEVTRPAVDTDVGTGQLLPLWVIRFVTPNPSLCDLRIGLAMDWERVQQLVPAHPALHAGMILFHPHADGPDWPRRQVTDACRHAAPDVETMRPCCGPALDGKRRGMLARDQALPRRAEAALCREDPARYPERSF